MTTQINFFASGSHFWDHMLPIVAELARTEPSRLGKLCSSATSYGYTQTSLPEPLIFLDHLSINPELPANHLPVVVASYGDYLQVGGGRWVALVEHGAGQTYRSNNGAPDKHPSNPGGNDREGFGLFLCPNEAVAQANRDSYPHIPAEVVGSPRLDYLTELAWRTPSAVGDKPTVAFAFHWPNSQCQESMWAFPHYEKALAPLQADFDVLVHAHPRIINRVYDMLSGSGLTVVNRFEKLLGADLLCVDNSSVGVEFAAATEKPVLWMNAPWYRKDFHHGGRFWDWVDGQVQVDQPEDLHQAICDAILEPPEASISRRKMVETVYSLRDGFAAKRAAQAILRYVQEGGQR